MKRLLVLLMVCLLCVQGFTQSTRKIRELEKQHAELQKQISASETLLQSTKKDVKSQLDNLALLSGQINERKKYIETIEQDVKIIQTEVSRLQVELKALQRELADKKKKYEQSVKYMYQNKSIQEKLMFIFSADNLSQMYRRLRYVREYADYQRLQGLQVERKQKQVSEKQQTLLASRKAKEEMLKQGEAERLKLEEQEMVMEATENIGVYPSPAQAGQLKVMSEEGMLSEGSIYALLVKKEGGGQTVTISSKKIRDYFPPAYTKEQIEEVIYSLLDQWKQGKEGELNAGDTV